MTESESQPSERRPARKWFLALGGLLLVLGVAGAAATLLELSFVLIFGPLLLVSSLMQLLTSFFAETGREKRLHFAAAGLEAVLGFFIMANPPQRLIGLIALIGVVFVVIGIVRLARSMITESHGKGWMILAGIVSLLVGLCVWTGWPDARLWFVGLCIAIDFICHGVSWSALALSERN